MEPRKRLSEILTVGRSADCHPAWDDHDADIALARWSVRLGAHGVFGDGRPSAARRHHYVDALIRRVYVRLSAGGDSGRKRTNDAQNYRHGLAAKQCGPVHSRIVHIYAPGRSGHARSIGR